NEPSGRKRTSRRVSCGASVRWKFPPRVYPAIFDRQKGPCITDVHPRTERGVRRTIGVHPENPIHLLSLELGAGAGTDKTTFMWAGGQFHYVAHPTRVPFAVYVGGIQVAFAAEPNQVVSAR